MPPKRDLVALIKERDRKRAQMHEASIRYTVLLEEVVRLNAEIAAEEQTEAEG